MPSYTKHCDCTIRHGEYLSAEVRRRAKSSDWALPHRKQLYIATKSYISPATARLEMMRRLGHVKPWEYKLASSRIAARAKRFGVRSKYAARSGRYTVVSPRQPMAAWNVMLHGRRIDTVYYTQEPGTPVGQQAEMIRISLVRHDNYDPDIRVSKARA